MKKNTVQPAEWHARASEQHPGGDDSLSVRQHIEMGSHPTEAMLYDYVLGWLEEDAAAIISQHLLFCGICTKHVLSMRQVEGTIEQRLSDWAESRENTDGRLFHISPSTKARYNLPEQDIPNTIATEYWEPLLTGQPATAAYMSAQEHVFRREDGDIRVSCLWRAQYVNKPAFIKIVWNANIKVRSEICAHFINPDTHELRSIISLGTHLSGEEWFTSQELGFDPSTEKWAVAIIVQELGE